MGIDQDVVDGGILKQRLKRPQAKNFVKHLAGKAITFPRTERSFLLQQEVLNYFLDLGASFDVLEGRQFLQVDLGKQLPVNGGF